MEETKKCPYCGGEIMATAKKCKHCKQWLTEKQSLTEPIRHQEIESGDGSLTHLYDYDDAITEDSKDKATIDEVVSENESEKEPEVDKSDNIGDNAVNTPVLPKEDRASDTPTTILPENTERTPQKVDLKTTTEIPYSVSSNRRIGFIIAIVFIFALFGVGAYYYSNKNEDMQKTQEDSVAFDDAANNILAYSIAVKKICNTLFYDMYWNWHTTITENYAYTMYGEKQECKDYREAIEMRRSLYRKKSNFNLYYILDFIEENLEICSKTQGEKYMAITDKLKVIYNRSKEAADYFVEISEHPVEDITSYRNHYEELLNSLGTAIASTDNLIRKVDIDKLGDIYYDNSIDEEYKKYINTVLKGIDSQASPVAIIQEFYQFVLGEKPMTDEAIDKYLSPNLKKDLWE